MGVDTLRPAIPTPTPVNPEVSLIVPAYNEANNSVRADAFRGMLEGNVAMLDQEFGADHEVLVVDDGSTDGTAAIAQEFGIQVISHPDAQNHGKGASIRLGMNQATGAYRAFADADGAYSPDTVRRLIDAVSGAADIAVAQREQAGHASLVRRAGHYALEQICQYYAPTDSADTQAGAKVFTAEAAKAIWPMVQADRFAADREAMHIAKRFGFRVADVPAAVRVVPGSHVRPVRDTAQIIRDTRQIARRSRHMITPVRQTSILTS